MTNTEMNIMKKLYNCWFFKPKYLDIFCLWHHKFSALWKDWKNSLKMKHLGRYSVRTKK